jgi:hypothetical protein
MNEGSYTEVTVNRNSLSAQKFGVWPTWVTLSRRGSSQPTLTSQWLSRNIRKSPRACRAPRMRDLMRPMGSCKHPVTHQLKSAYMYIYIYIYHLQRSYTCSPFFPMKVPSLQISDRNLSQLRRCQLRYEQRVSQVQIQGATAMPNPFSQNFSWWCSLDKMQTDAACCQI